MAHVYVGYDEYGLEGVDDEFIQFIFDIVVSLTKLDPDSEAGLVVTSDERMQQLNKQYRGKDSSTNVLSFGYAETTPEEFMDPGDENYIGDIYMSRAKILEEAKAAGISDRERFVRLFVHGALHLAGMNHEIESEAISMEDLEDKIVDQVLL